MSNDEYIKRSDALKAILGVSIYDTIEELEGARTIAENTWADGLYDAYKIIEEEVDAADVEPKRRWIPVTEGLPERGTEVLAAIYGTDLIVQEDGESLEDAVRRARSGPGRVEMGYLDKDGIWTEILFGAPMMVLPRYWMPLPEPPKNDEEESYENRT